MKQSRERGIPNAVMMRPPVSDQAAMEVFEPSCPAAVANAFYSQVENEDKDMASEFSKLMSHANPSGIGPLEVISRAAALFRGHRELIHGFNGFLPDEHKIALPNNDQVMNSSEHEERHMALEAEFEDPDEDKEKDLDLSQRRLLPQGKSAEQVDRQVCEQPQVEKQKESYGKGEAERVLNDSNHPFNLDRILGRVAAVQTIPQQKVGQNGEASDEDPDKDKEKDLDYSHRRLLPQGKSAEQVDRQVPEQPQAGKQKEGDGKGEAERVSDHLFDLEGILGRAVAVQTIPQQKVGQKGDAADEDPDKEKHLDHSQRRLISQGKSAKQVGSPIQKQVCKEPQTGKRKESCGKRGDGRILNDNENHLLNLDGIVRRAAAVQTMTQQMVGQRGEAAKEEADKDKEKDVDILQKRVRPQRKCTEHVGRQIGKRVSKQSQAEMLKESHQKPAKRQSRAEKRQAEHYRMRAEEVLNRSQDDRFEVDLLIERAAVTIKKMDQLLDYIKSPQFKMSTFLLEDHLSAINLRCIKQLYGHDALEVIVLLREHPAKAAPVVLIRLKQKHDEWSLCRIEMNKVWEGVESKSLHILKTQRA